MIRSAIIFCLVNYCAFLFSQEIKLSRSFPASRKNLPLEILNNHPDYFFLLRYNKAVHDFAVERRAKPSAEILSFTPLRLDSVNADWFDYEKLDHLFFEKGNSLFFFFEKVLNTERFLFLKVIDTTGRSGGFIELLHLQIQKPVIAVGFRYKLTEENNLLIVASQIYGNGALKKVVYLYDPSQRKMLARKIIPIENEDTGYSEAFTFNSEGDLFYALVKSRIVSHKRKYMDHMQVEIPVYFYDTISLVSMRRASDNINNAVVSANLTALHWISLNCRGEGLFINVHYSAEDTSGKQNVYFLNEVRSIDLMRLKYSTKTKLLARLESQLTYYDGTDYNSAADKDFRQIAQFKNNEDQILISHRKDKDYYKEILLWRVNESNGRVFDQQLIPRKTFYFDDRTSFKNMGGVAFQQCNGSLSAYLLENKRNLKQIPQNFKFAKFSRQRHLPAGALVRYTLDRNGDLHKNMIYMNESLYAVPLLYQSDQCDFIFYLTRGAIEKFAFLKENL